jgi:hypothetical protein
VAQAAIKPSAPGAAALVIIDMISDLRFEDASAIRAPRMHYRAHHQAPAR